ncbi:IclR family transcriptional regulator [Lelliottia sp. WAP21]|uniref:IclR family transcriptional regulator n=1 Tax=Lelliottia sp. WAP21 TaxID=2877426 RepID=UPI001E43E6CE|nr:IclR family transcriptional regulator [Lelliottia sp. WAP21]
MIRKGCNSIVRAEKILTHIAWVGVASYMELLKEFKYPKSSLLNLLNVMVDCGFLIKNKSNHYSLGIKNYELGCQALHRQNIFEVTKRPMQELSLKSGLVCHLGAMEGYSAIYLDKIESPDSVPTSKSWIGKKLGLHLTALGKALLAWKTREELDYFLDAITLTQYTCNTFTDKKLFLEELQRTRIRGWAIDNEESTYGVVCLSMPAFNMYNRVNYAISLSGDPVIYSGDKIHIYLGMLRKCACQISSGLGHRNESEYLRKGS